MQLLSEILHAAIRGLNSLADFEMLQCFNEKYFGNTVENRNPTLLEVLRFEEEVLRQKITWREKYESVICGWMMSKSAKGSLNVHKSKPARGVPATGTTGGNAAETKPAGDATNDGSSTADAAAGQNKHNDNASVTTVANEPAKSTPIDNNVPSIANNDSGKPEVHNHPAEVPKTAEGGDNYHGHGHSEHVSEHDVTKRPDENNVEKTANEKTSEANENKKEDVEAS